MSSIDRKSPRSPSAWADFERLGLLAVGFGARGAMVLAHAGYPARAISSKRWLSIACCCQVGLLPGRLAIQAYLRESDSGVPLHDSHSTPTLDQLAFCAQAMLADEADPPRSDSVPPGLGSQLWLELAMEPYGPAPRAAELASRLAPGFDPMEPVLALAASPEGRSQLSKHSPLLGSILASSPGLRSQADMGALLWLLDLLGASPLAAPLRDRIAAMGHARIASGMLDRADLLGCSRLDGARDAFNVAPLHILVAASSAMARASHAIFPRDGAFAPPLPHTAVGWALSQIDLLGPRNFGLLSRARASSLDWGAWRHGAIVFGRWEAASALPLAEGAIADLSPDAFAHGVACILSGRSMLPTTASFGPGGALRSFALQCLRRQPNPVIYCSQARERLASLGSTLSSRLPPALAWLAEIGALAESSAIELDSPPKSAAPSRSGPARL